jgi:hypothetical protein
MAGFNSVRDLVDSIEDGNFIISSFRKTPSQATLAGHWCDLSMAPGNPVTNFYASTPLLAARLNGNEGIYAGQNVSPQTKHLKTLTTISVAAAAVPITIMLCDYLLYYPFIDGDSTDEQALDNSVTLSRYTSGIGVKAFVVAQGSYVGGARFSISYTNQAGVSGRISRFSTSNTTTFTSTLISCGLAAAQTGPFITLQEGDTGIRSVESFTFETANGGIFALVLCAPIGTTTIRGIDAPVEKDFIKDTGLSSPRVYDGAYLNFIALPNASIAAAPIIGTCEIIWS